MSMTFTKLFSSITESTIWVEPYPTRIAWVSMLAMADRKGRVYASIPGLAKRAGITLEECEAALDRFQQPDKYSRTPDNDGRRIEPMDGGWRLLNYEKYRSIRDDESRREYQRDWDQVNRPSRKKSESDKSDKKRPPPTQAEAEAEADITPQVERVVIADTSVPQPAPQPLSWPSLDDSRVTTLHGICLGERIQVRSAEVQQWVADGVSEEVLRAAIAKGRKKSGALSAKFLTMLIGDVRASGLGYDGDAVTAAAIAAIAAREGNATH